MRSPSGSGWPTTRNMKGPTVSDRPKHLLNDVDHSSTIVAPLTRNLIDDAAPLQFRILAWDNLRSDSDVMVG